MAEFKSFDRDVRVSGEVVMAFVAGFPQEARKSGLEILAKHGLESPEPGRRYPLQNFLDAMKDISGAFSAQMLFRIGEQIATHAQLPPGITDLQACLSSIDVAYHMNHEGGEIGNYEYVYLGKEGGLHRAKMSCRNPYPCAFDRGVLEGFTKRFAPPGSYDIIVRHDDSESCRRRGDESCVYLISWI